MKKIFLVLTLMAVLTTPVLAQTDIYQLGHPVKKVGELFPTIVHIGIMSNSSVNPAALDLASNGFIAPFDIILSTVRQSADGSLWRTTFNTGTGQSSSSFIVEGITITNMLALPADGLVIVNMEMEQYFPVIQRAKPVKRSMDFYFKGVQNETIRGSNTATNTAFERMLMKINKQPIKDR